jgi:acetyl-CoA carboxylase carboxyl transferase subunit alpha
LIDYQDFEKQLNRYEDKIKRLKPLEISNPAIQQEIEELEEKMKRLQEEVYAKLTSWQRTQLARHTNRPNSLDYITFLAHDFVELHGDRLFGDDHAVIGGVGLFRNRPVVMIGHQKGKSVKEKVFRNFGMPHPEGYRKALRLMELAKKFRKPLITFIDTPGAYPGVGAEERGQSEAIARNLLHMVELPVPIVVVVIGEGGSGGALAMGIGDRILMLEHAVYSVISPEGCAAILWNDPAKVSHAAEALKMTARDLLNLQVIDEIVPEPPGGAHRDPSRMFDILNEAIESSLSELENIPVQELLQQRYMKYQKMGMYTEDRP